MFTNTSEPRFSQTAPEQQGRAGKIEEERLREEKRREQPTWLPAVDGEGEGGIHLVPLRRPKDMVTAGGAEVEVGIGVGVNVGSASASASSSICLSLRLHLAVNSFPCRDCGQWTSAGQDPYPELQTETETELCSNGPHCPSLICVFHWILRR